VNAAVALAPEAPDRGVAAPGEPASADEEPAKTPARVRLIVATVRLFMITPVESGVVADRDGDLGAVFIAPGGAAPVAPVRLPVPRLPGSPTVPLAASAMPSMVRLRAKGPKPGNPWG
jgi:hypothetical protein